LSGARTSVAHGAQPESWIAASITSAEPSPDTLSTTVTRVLPWAST
jgi:hypothetical protein